MTHPIDRGAEDIIFEEAEKLQKPLTLVSEEYGTKDIYGGGPKLLIDPIDGSRNAVSGVPLFSTSIALIDGETIGDMSIGYVVNLITGDEFWAVAGKGSFLNGKPIRTQQDDTCKVIAYEAQNPHKDISSILPLLTLFNRARCFGSTALDLSFVAQGAVSMVVIPSPSRSFDFASGYLLVKEAGGIITDIKGEAIDGVKAGVKRSTSILASANAALHQKALAAVST
jgi:myo-inositol-1(or 4)-monophosphatase